MNPFQLMQVPSMAAFFRHFFILLLLFFSAQSIEVFASQYDKKIINDITQLNPIPVNRIVRPQSVEDIIQAVKNTKGPVSIGGGRFSMGGQTATENAVQIDMRRFNKVLAFSQEKKEITPNKKKSSIKLFLMEETYLKSAK